MSTFEQLIRLSQPNAKQQINITGETLNGFVQGQCIQIDNVEVVIDQPAQSITVTGQSTFLNVSNLTTTMQVSLDKNQQPQYSVQLTSTKTPLSLKKLIQSFAPDLPIPVDLSIAQLKLLVSPGQSCQFSGLMAAAPKTWQLNLGPTTFEIKNINFDLLIQKQPSGYQSSGSLKGQLSIGNNITISTNYTMPGEFSIGGDVGKLNFAELLSKLTDKAVKLPKGLDFTLLDASVMIKKNSAGLVFQLASMVKGFGYLAFELKKTQGKWGAAAGFSLDSELGLSDIPGLSVLKPLDKIAVMQDFTLVISSYDGPKFQFPAITAFNNPVLPRTNVVLPASSGGLINGINCYGAWQIENSGKQGKLLRQLLGLDPTLAVTVQVSNPPNQQSSLYTTIATTINGNSPLIGELGIAFNQGTPEFFASATTDVKIGGRKCRFDLALSLVTSGAYFTGSMLGTVKVGGLQLSNLVLMTGLNYAGAPSLGVSASIDVASFSSSVSLFFNANNPAQSVFAGAISDLSLADITSVFANVNKLPDGFADVLAGIKLSGTNEFTIPAEVTTSLDNLEQSGVKAAFKTHGGIELLGSDHDLLIVVKHKGSQWAITDLPDMMKHYSLKLTDQGITVTLDAQVYNVPQSTKVGSLTFNQGILLNGKVSVLNQSATCRIEVNPNKGIVLAAELERPLIIYKQSFFALSAADDANDGAEVSIATINQPNHPDPALKRPHIYINGQLQMMGLIGACYVSITSGGFIFDLAISQKRTVNLSAIDGSIEQALQIKGDMGNINQLSASVSSAAVCRLRFDLAQLGKARFNTNVSGQVAISFDGKAAKASFKGRFAFQGQSYNIACTLKVDGDDLANLANIIAKEVKDCVTDIFSDAGRWANAVGDGVMEGIEDIDATSKVLNQHFKQSAEDAAKILRGAGNNIDSIGNSLKSVYKLDVNGMKKALSGAGYATSSVDRFINNSYKSVIEAAAKAAKASQQAAASAAKSAQKAATSTAKKAKKKGKKAKKKAKKMFK